MSGIAQLQQYQDLEAMRQGEPMPVTMTPEARELAPQVAQGIAEAALMFPTGASLPDAMGLQPDPLSDEYYSSMWENLRQGEYVDAALQGLGLGADALTAIGAAGTATGVGAPAGLAAMGAGVGLSGLSTAMLAARRADRVDPGDIPTPRREITPEQDEEYLAAVQRGDEEEAQRLVDQALVQTGRMAFNPEETTAFTVRTAPPPQRTVTRYKAMRLVDGELRPLYVGATDPVPMGVWLDAKEGGYRFQNLKGSMRVPARTGDVTKIPNDQVRQELIENGFLPEGSTATTIKTVAYRPGWHVGSLPYNPQGGGPRDKGYKKGQADPEHPYQHILGPDIVIAEVELAADRADEWTQVFQDTATRTKAGEIQLSRSGVREVPVDGYYDYTTNPNNYDNPGTWSIGGSLKVNRLLTQQEADTIMREQGFTPQRRVANNIDPSTVDVRRYGVGRSVLYDREGNPIPLSRRFSAAGVGALAAGTAYSLREQTEQDMENMKNELREYLRNTPAQ